MAFTDVAIKSLKPKPKEYTRSGKDADRGLVVRVHPSGRKTFYHYYAHPDTGKTVRLKLGQYPALKLKRAREMVTANREGLALGNDPRSAQLAAKVLAKTAGHRLGTVAELFDVYLEAPKKNGEPKKSLKNIRRSVEKDLTKNPGFPDFPKLLARDVRAKHIVEVLTPVSKRAPVVANHLRSYIMAAFTFGKVYDNKYQFGDSGIKFGLEGIANPVEAIEPDRSVERAGSRYLTWAEIKDALSSEYIPDKHKLQIKLLLAYGSRVGEICYMPTTELDFKKKLWTLSAERSKTGRANMLPITDLTERIFREACEVCGLTGGYLFPKYVGFVGYDCSGHTSKNVLAKYIRIHCAETGMKKFVPRDLRRTFKTLAAEEGFSSDILNRIQNHALHGVDMKHYNMATYIERKREALEKWHNLLIAEAGF